MTETILTPDSEILADKIVQGILEKKGENIVKIDLRNMHNSISDYFVICHGTSNRHVDAISDSIVEEVRKELGDKPNAVEGKNLAEWILIDYVNVIVHVFQEEQREHYALEDLWADAPTENITE